MEPELRDLYENASDVVNQLYGLKSISESDAKEQMIKIESVNKAFNVYYSHKIECFF